MFFTTKSKRIIEGVPVSNVSIFPVPAPTPNPSCPVPDLSVRQALMVVGGTQRKQHHTPSNASTPFERTGERNGKLILKHIETLWLFQAFLFL